MLTFSLRFLIFTLSTDKLNPGRTGFGYAKTSSKESEGLEPPALKETKPLEVPKYMVPSFTF